MKYNLLREMKPINIKAEIQVKADSDLQQHVPYQQIGVCSHLNREYTYNI